MKNALLLNLILALVIPLSAFAGNGPPPPGYKSSKVDQRDSYAPQFPAPAPPPPPNNRISAPSPLDYLLTLSEKSASGIGETATFKIIFEVASGKVNLVNVNRYKYHFDFATEALGYRKPVEIFNKNYVGEISKRELVLGSVILLKNRSFNLGYQALFELWSGDSLDANGLKVVLSAVQSELPKQIKLQFHPLSTDQEKLAATNFQKQDFVLTSDLTGNREFLIFNKADAFGYLRFASNDPTVENDFDLTTIAVYDKVPNDVGLVGGVITAEPQTPLSHVNVKSMNRNTMNIYVKSARQALRAYENKPVKIILTGTKPVITVLNESEARSLIANFWNQRRPKLNGRPSSIIDPAYKETFVPLYSYYKSLPSKALHSEMIKKVGAKAANLGLLNLLTKRLNLPFATSPETLGVPFNFYDDFMNLQQAGLDLTNPAKISTPLIETQKILNRYELLNPNIIHPTSQVRQGLSEIKEIYFRSKVPANLLKAFKKFIADDSSSPVHISKTPRVRLRSSTNSEDLDGFTGAGLYDSDGVSLYKKRADDTYDRTQPLAWAEIEKKLIKVIPALYSSVWNERAFQEREWYQMNGSQHLDIKVGLAFHNAFPLKDFNGIAEHANGVAVTTNIYDPSEWGKLYINAQHYDLAVTNPPDAKDLTELGEPTDRTYTTEEILVTTYTADDTNNSSPNNWTRWPMQYLSRSSIKNGASVFEPGETLKLSRALHLLNKEMAKVYGKDMTVFPIDVEWKVYGPQRTLVIKQARPLTVKPTH